MAMDGGYLAEEVADAKVTSKAETLCIIEGVTLELLEAVASGEDPALHLVRIMITILVDIIIATVGLIGFIFYGLFV